jgi:hypothetical protein
MHTTGMSFKAIGRQMGYHYSVVSQAKTGSRLTNGSFTMSVNSNHVVLNTMPNVFVDVGLPTVDA